MSTTLNLIAYEGVSPEFAGEPAAALPGHAVVGRVTAGQRVWLGAGSVIRADGHYVRIGDELHLGRGATVHIAHDLYPTLIGDRVAVGADAVVHACTVRDDVVVEEGSVILDGSLVGAGSVLEAGSIVYPRSILEPGALYAGRPAELVRKLNPNELRARAESQRARNLAASAEWVCRPQATHATPSAYVSGTCDLTGEVHLAEGASVWFGSRLDGLVTLGRLCNVQDNSVLRAGRRGISVGDETTIGHNVQLLECTIGANCLIGIGSHIAPGTVVRDHSFVAAGAVTEPGQYLEAGWFWGGQPARQLAPLSDAKRALIRKTAVVYESYVRTFRELGELPANAKFN